MSCMALCSLRCINVISAAKCHFGFLSVRACLLCLTAHSVFTQYALTPLVTTTTTMQLNTLAMCHQADGVLHARQSSSSNAQFTSSSSGSSSSSSVNSGSSSGGSSGTSTVSESHSHREVATEFMTLWDALNTSTDDRCAVPACMKPLQSASVTAYNCYTLQSLQCTTRSICVSACIRSQSDISHYTSTTSNVLCVQACIATAACEHITHGCTRTRCFAAVAASTHADLS
jgi:hypothetical protein